MKYVYIIERLHKDVAKDRLSNTIVSTFSSKAKAFNRIIELMNDLNECGWNLVFDKFPNEPDYLRIWQYIDNNPAVWLEDKYYSE